MMKSAPWFHGPIDRKVAEKHLKTCGKVSCSGQDKRTDRKRQAGRQADRSAKQNKKNKQKKRNTVACGHGKRQTQADRGKDR